MSADASAGSTTTWCDHCSAYRSGDTSCAECGRTFAEGAEPPETESAPWHFWLIVLALAGYLLWRLVQGVGWLVS